MLNLYSLNADGTGAVSRLTDSPVAQVPMSWHPSGQFLSFVQNTVVPTGCDLMILPMEGNATRGWTPGKPTVFLATLASELYSMFSPDGRWIAYASNESGSAYEGPWRISTEGGSFPRWSPTTHELLVLNPAGKVLFAPYTIVGDSFCADTPPVWTSTRAVGLGLNTPKLRQSSGNPLAPSRRTPIWLDCGQGWGLWQASACVDAHWRSLMPTHIEVLEAEVLNLSSAERSRLLERLIASLDADPEIEEAWVTEAQRRESAINNGSVVPVPGNEAMARLRARFK